MLAGSWKLSIEFLNGLNINFTRGMLTIERQVLWYTHTAWTPKLALLRRRSNYTKSFWNRQSWNIFYVCYKIFTRKSKKELLHSTTSYVSIELWTLLPPAPRVHQKGNNGQRWFSCHALFVQYHSVLSQKQFLVSCLFFSKSNFTVEVSTLCTSSENY